MTGDLTAQSEARASALAERVEALERKANWLRRWVMVLSAALVGIGIAGASGPQELRLRKLTIEDGDGNTRFVASTESNGTAEIHLFDPAGKSHISALTLTDGTATFGVGDRDGKERILAGIDSKGSATFSVSDRDSKPRITASTDSDGGAVLGISDREGKPTWIQGSK